jgi:hypothetical protein
MLEVAKIVAAAIIVSVGVAGAASAATVSGLTFSVGSDCSPSTGGDHFHSNSDGIWDNPSGKAEVGNFVGTCAEKVRGLSEFDLAGLSTTTEASVAFDVSQLEGLFPENSDPYIGWIRIVAYDGNNLEDLSDFQAPPTGSVGRFSTGGLSVGDTLTFDITEIFNDAIVAGDSSLGIRLSMGRSFGGDAVTFDNFQLVTSAPLPAGLPFLLTALGCLGIVARRRKA